MKIVQQTINNECGVCVINMMANHLYHKNIDKNEVLKHANLSCQGINLLDLEILASKFGLEAESYETEVKEIVDLKIKDYFVAMISENGSQHFVVCKLTHQKTFKIYNPNGKIYLLNQEEFQSLFLNIIVRFKKVSRFLDYQIFDKKYLSEIKFSTLFVIVLLEMISIPISILISKLTNYIFDLVIQKNLIINLVNIGLIYLFVFLLNGFKILFQEVFVNKKVNQIELKIHHQIIDYLGKKEQTFFNKTSMGEMNSISSTIDNVVSFLVIIKPKLYVNILYASIIILILTINSWTLVIVSLAFSFIVIILSLIIFKYNKKIIPNLINQQNEVFNSYQNYLQVINYEYNLSKFMFLVNNYKNKLMSLVVQEKQIKLVNLKVEFWINLSNHISLFAIIAVVILNAHYSNSKINYGNLMFIIFLHNSLSEIGSSLTSFIMNGANLKHNLSIIEKFYYINNIEEKPGIILEEVNSIEIKFKEQLFKISNNTLILGKSGIGKSTLLKQMLNFNNYQDKVKINGVDANSYLTKSLQSKIIYHPSSANIMDFDLELFMNDKENIELLRSISSETNINWAFLSQNDQNNLSSGQRQIIAFINLIKTKNSLILLDEPLSHVDPIVKNLVLKYALSMLQKNNLIIYVSHDMQLKNFFNQVINLNEKFLN